MKTEILDKSYIEKIKNLIKQGEVVALPTETVYGLAADATNDVAIKKIFTAKGRPLNHPLIVHIDKFSKIEYWAKSVPDIVKKISEAFWPGPLTIILQKNDHVSPVITGGLDTVAIRIPRNDVILEVINKVGFGIVAPSANRYKSLSPTNPEHVLKTLDGKIAAVVDGGSSEVGIESTILDVSVEKPRILRAGVITKSNIENALNIEVDEPKRHSVSVSGNVLEHYQPDKPLYIFSKEKIYNEMNNLQHNAILCLTDFSEKLKEKNMVIQMPNNYLEYSKLLYSKLHLIDKSNVDKIIVENPPDNSNWNCVNDRLYKAMTKNS